MLSSISWHHYLATVVILAGSYYLYVVLRYYQSEIAYLFGKKSKGTEQFAGAPSSAFTVMGEAKLENGVTLSDPQQLEFAESLPEEPETSPALVPSAFKSTDVAIGPSQELVSEAGNLIEAFKEIDDKQEFITLLGILINSYKRFKDEIDLLNTLDRIVKLSKNKLKFSIALADLQSTWT